MSRYSEYVKSVKDKEITRFFGEVRRKSNKYFHFCRMVSDDVAIIVTNNLTTINGSPAMIVGENSAVFLKDWNIVPVRMERGTMNSYAVKVDRRYYKPYTFSQPFDYTGEEMSTFDDVLDVARMQDEADEPVAIGHGA